MNFGIEPPCSINHEVGYYIYIYIYIYIYLYIWSRTYCRRLGWAGLIAGMEEDRCAFKILTLRLHIQERDL